jgi:hypothetical protein
VAAALAFGIARRQRVSGFVSPSVKTNLDFKGAVQELGSRQQGRLRLASQDINKRIKLENVREVNIVGAWRDGAENSIMSGVSTATASICCCSSRPLESSNAEKATIQKQKADAAKVDAEADSFRSRRWCRGAAIN